MPQRTSRLAELWTVLSFERSPMRLGEGNSSEATREFELTK